MSDPAPPAETPASAAVPASGPWQPPSAQELQKLLPQYEITALLGRGGMGAVYKGTQIALDRPVAIKILSNTLDEADASFAERFKNEARALGKLSHPGIVSVYDFGEAANGLLYIVMEFIDGTDVAKMISQQKRLHTEHAMAITAHVCDALAYAHERGIIHRDIKPANIMVGYDGVVKVADFGLAKMTKSGESGLTQSGMAMGTLHYMAPEALMLGTAVDHRADIYAVGVMLYQMLTGKVPHGMFELPSMQVPGLDPRYDGIISKAMREDRDLRYPSIRELRGDLDAILTQPVVKVEAAAEKAPAALNTQARPQRPGGKPYRPPQPEVIVRTEKKSSPLLWAALFVCAGLAAWMLVKKGEGVKTPEATATPAAGGTLEPAKTPGTGGNAPVSAPAGKMDLAATTKEQPFINSLGMKFVPVPGTGVLMCIHETRRQDYAAYAAAVPGVDGGWKDVIFEGVRCGHENDHPVVGVSWENANGFCQWLSQQEGHQYRLPTDEEWSMAVGIGVKEERTASSTPETLSNQVQGQFPWAGGFPPTTQDRAGNYGDLTWRDQFPNKPFFSGYTDLFVTTAPVMSFKPNPLGIYDLGGNVWEWVEDWWNAEHKHHVVRGASFKNTDSSWMNSSSRARREPSTYLDGDGFRVVVVAGRDLKSIAVASPPNAPVPTAISPDAKTPPVVATVPPPSQADTATMEILVNVDFAQPNEGFPDSSSRKIESLWRDGHYELKAVSGAIWWPAQPLIQKLSLEDFVCEVEARVPFVASGAWGIGLPNKIQQKGSWWQAFTFDATGQVTVPSPSNWKANRLKSAAVPAGEGWYKVRLEALQSHFRLFINDQFVVEAPQEGRISPNGITLLLNTPNNPETSFQVWFRRIRVWQPKSASSPAPVPVAVAPATPAAPSALPAGPTTWTDTKGRSITASFKAIEGDKVILDIAGKATPVPLATLSAESQKLAQSYQTQVKPVIAAPASVPMPASTALPLASTLTPQQVATVLLDAGSELTALAAGRKVQISKEADIPSGAFQITELAFGLRSVPGKPLPWQVLRQLPDLRILQVNLDAAASLQPADLLPLNTLGKLTFLGLGGQRMMFPPDIVAAVPSMPSVLTLSVDVDLFRPADLGKFTAKFPKTNALYLEEIAKPGTVMAQAMPSLAGLKELRSLRITGGSFTASGAAVLKKLNELNGLQLYSMDQVQWTEMAAMNRITTMEINGVPALDDGAMLELARMKNLAALRLNNISVTDNGLAHLGNAKNLTSIVLQRLKNITSTGVLALQRALPKCEVITE